MSYYASAWKQSISDDTMIFAEKQIIVSKSSWNLGSSCRSYLSFKMFYACLQYPIGKKTVPSEKISSQMQLSIGTAHMKRADRIFFLRDNTTHICYQRMLPSTDSTYKLSAENETDILHLTPNFEALPPNTIFFLALAHYCGVCCFC